MSLGTDTIGNVIRIDNAIEKFPKQLKVKKQELERTKRQYATAKSKVGKPFEKRRS